MLCSKYNDLLEGASVASARYFEAVTKIFHIAGRGRRESFVDAHHHCDVCLNDCKQAKAALLAHVVAHGCAFA